MSAALVLPAGELDLPAFLPDASSGVVRTVTAADVRATGTRALMMNVFHLMQRPGSTVVKALGGLHGMAGWDGPIITDSGGFQAYSVAAQDSKRGSISDKGLSFRSEAGRVFRLDPAKSVRLQLGFGADVVTCLDQCTATDAPREQQELAVTRTIRWAAACRAEFDRGLDGREHDRRPLLMAIVQGGGHPDLRRRCAEALLDIGFDLYGFGGWPLGPDGGLLADELALVRDLVPAALPLHALGVGHPTSVARCIRMGYGLADSSLPTKDARRGRLYLFEEGGGDSFGRIYINDERHRRSLDPIDPTCDCAACTTTTRGFLHHLFALRDGNAGRLATIHNLRHMARVVAAAAR